MCSFDDRSSKNTRKKVSHKAIFLSNRAFPILYTNQFKVKIKDKFVRGFVGKVLKKEKLTNILTHFIIWDISEQKFFRYSIKLRFFLELFSKLNPHMESYIGT